MWIERKIGELAGPARIGRVVTSKSGASLIYQGQTFRSLKGRGFKANYFDVESGEEYWISGCHHDGMDALYSTDVEIDDDVREEYWVTIRGQPDMKHVSRFRAPGKY
jgi:hypothetical protein